MVRIKYTINIQVGKKSIIVAIIIIIIIIDGVQKNSHNKIYILTNTYFKIFLNFFCCCFYNFHERSHTLQLKNVRMIN